MSKAIDYKVLVDMINDYAENGQLFWVAGIAKECLAVYKNHLDELHPQARIAVEYYPEEEKGGK